MCVPTVCQVVLWGEEASVDNLSEVVTPELRLEWTSNHEHIWGEQAPRRGNSTGKSLCGNELGHFQERRESSQDDPHNGAMGPKVIRHFYDS